MVGVFSERRLIDGRLTPCDPLKNVGEKGRASKPDQVIPAIRGWANDAVIVMQPRKRFVDIFGRERREIAADQTRGRKTVLENLLKRIVHSGPKISAGLWEILIGWT